MEEKLIKYIIIHVLTVYYFADKFMKAKKLC